MQIFRLLRTKEWIKNTFLFIPAFFSGIIVNHDTFFSLVLGFLAFSFASSSIYIINDYKDIEHDRRHPVKKNRPLASGQVRVASAITIAILLFLVSAFLSYYLSIYFFAVTMIYFLMNIGYSFGLKNASIIDIVIISLGFILRIFAGGFLADVLISHWLIIMIFLLSMMMAIAKRRDDVLVFNHSGEATRKSIVQYNLDFTNVLLPMFGSIIIVAYIMYTLSDEIQAKYGSDKIYFTSFFVILGVIRYLQITMVEKKSGSPTKILYSDLFIILTILGFIASFVFIIYT